MYDEEGNLLYVGAANRPEERWGDHANKPWWQAVARTELHHYPTRKEALEAEARAIKLESPLHNQVVPNADGSVRGAHLREDSPALARRRTKRTP
ncbi:GIY-YIG nuclease family protein [Actinomadura harenae]|uniref:GIY-YIG nuclease family protein n=1 Tax=Actinomadura harenae TaxID=2483351 RepID=UPI0013152E8A|nr:GIY-YIG nuclease family protein [Actinomadura harenae]